MDHIISGIQQLGIGTLDVEASWAWYRRVFGIDVKIFRDVAEAPLMTRYTGGTVYRREAVLAMSMQGGGGLEIWQYKNRHPKAPATPPAFGDLGIFAAKIKARNVEKAFRHMQRERVYLLTDLIQDMRGNPTFYLQDPEGNCFQVVQGTDFFGRSKAKTAGVFGAVIGVSDIERSLWLYKELLAHKFVVSDQSGHFQDLASLPGGDGKFRRLVLQNGLDRKGPFSKWLGNSQIELVQRLDGKGEKIYRDRYWGDLGFMHLCFDVSQMHYIKLDLQSQGLDFTVDSATSFDMGEAAGRFTYVEDEDGTLIEFVETHRIPILKKFNWYLDLRKRDIEKPLPWWMIKFMGLNRVR